MVKPNIKYRVTLTGEEREFLRKLVRKGNTAGYRIRHAQVLLALDEIPANEAWTDEKIAQAYGVHIRTIGNMRKRFVEESFEAALERKKRETPPWIKIGGEAEAKIIALTCSAPPEGRCRWTLKLLANRVVELGILDSISDHGIGDVLKKTKLSHGCRKNGA
jgi:transposase